MQNFLSSFAFPLFLAVAASSVYSVTAQDSSTVSDITVASTIAATYDCTVTTLWSQTDHPVDYPTEAHLSSPVLVVHDDFYTLFEAGTLVTPGVQMVAETGDTLSLQDEMSASSPSVTGYSIGVPMWNTDVGDIPASDIIGREQTIPGGITFFPSSLKLSTIVMLAPSPDWFTGVNGFEPVQDDKWLSSFTLNSMPWDAGTDSGEMFKSDDLPTDPEEPPAPMTLDTTTNNAFVDVSDTQILPVVSWSCTLQDTEPATEEMDSPTVGSGNDSAGSKIQGTSATTAAVVVALLSSMMLATGWM